MPRDRRAPDSVGARRQVRGSRCVCGTKNGRSSTRAKPAASSSASTSSSGYCRGFRSKTSFRSVNAATRRKNARTVVGVVDRAEDRRRRDRLVRSERIEIPERHRRRRRRGAAAPRRPSRAPSRHRIPQAACEKVSAEAAVPARQVEYLVAVPQPDAERGDELGPVGEVGVAVGVLGIRPARRLARVLLRLRVVLGHSRATVSGCRRTNRAMLRACHSVWRERKRRSDHLRPVVPDARRGHVPPFPARAHRAVAEVDVLDVVTVALVPAAELVEHHATHEEECAEQPVGLDRLVDVLVEVVVRRAGARAGEEQPQRRPADERATHGREAPPRRLPRAVGPRDARAGDSAPVASRGEADERRDRARLRNRVRVRVQRPTRRSSPATPRLTFSARRRGRSFSSRRAPREARQAPSRAGSRRRRARPPAARARAAASASSSRVAVRDDDRRDAHRPSASR